MKGFSCELDMKILLALKQISYLVTHRTVKLNVIPTYIYMSI